MLKRRQQPIRTISSTWRLVKAAAFCFLFAQVSWIVGPKNPSSVWFIYIATAAFAVYGITVVLGSFLASGFSWTSWILIAASLVLSIGICSAMLPVFSHGGLAEDETLVKIHEFAKDYVFRAESLVPEEELRKAVQLAFEQESAESLQEARKHLLSIPKGSGSYQSAQALLKVVQFRLDQTAVPKGVSKNLMPIGVMTVEQTKHGLRVTLRNNTRKNVRNIRYRVSYFRMTDGMQIQPDNESTIGKVLPARAIQTFELSNDSGNDDVYRSFTLVHWD